MKIDPSIPLEIACLTGCGVGTGWGAAVNSAEVRPGQTVIVMGIGGIGINAVQGAAHAGAAHVIAVDPVAFKRDSALRFGATHAVETIKEAAAIARELTDGQGADAAIVTVGVTTGAARRAACGPCARPGRAWWSGSARPAPATGDIPLTELVLYQKRLQGSLFGACAPTRRHPRAAAAVAGGALKLDELVTTRYPLDDIAQGFADMHAGRNLRGVVVFDA